MLPESTCRKPSCTLVLHREECGTAGEGDPWSLSLANLPFLSLKPVASSVKGDNNVLLRADGVRTGRDDAHEALGTRLEQDGSFTVCQAARNLNLQEAKQPPTCCFTGLGEQQRRA